MNSNPGSPAEIVTFMVIVPLLAFSVLMALLIRYNKAEPEYRGKMALWFRWPYVLISLPILVLMVGFVMCRG